MEPTNKLVNPMSTDFYQITMSYAYWKTGMHEEEAVFDLFFRKNPFEREFAIYTGLQEKLRLFENFHFNDDLKNRTLIGADGKHWRGLPWPAKK